MSIYKRGDIWWYKFTWNGKAIRGSTKQGNKRVAEQVEAARKTEFAKGEVGIRDRVKVPTLGEFADGEFLPFVQVDRKEKPRTIDFYRQRVARFRAYPKLWNLPLDEIKAEDITTYVGTRQALGMQTSTINRDLATLRRMFKFAMERERVSKLLPKVRLLPGERRRERVVSAAEETAYLEAAAPLLRDFAILEFDCGLRPEEAHRLMWPQIRNRSVEIHKGKTLHARRGIEATDRVWEMLMRRRQEVIGDWVFPAPTESGHINEDSLKKQHAGAIKAAGITPFVIYSLRHTCLTRWAESGMDIYTLKKLAGHADINTTMRYVHMSDSSTREALKKAREVQGGHKSGHTAIAAARSNRNTGRKAI